jgi:hypothetical protein
MTRRTYSTLWPATIIAVLLTAGSASAQSFGVRAGASVDPDQFYFGGHLETDPLIDRLHFKPNLEIGVGDDVTTLAVNMEVVYKVPLRRQPWTFYAGGGPAINYFNRENRSDTEPGLNLLAGLQHENGFFFEVKGGLFDSPDLKFGVGYVFGR